MHACEEFYNSVMSIMVVVTWHCCQTNQEGKVIAAYVHNTSPAAVGTIIAVMEGSLKLQQPMRVLTRQQAWG